MGKTAVIVVDMLRDSVDPDSPYGIGGEGRKIIPSLQRLLATVRAKGLPVIFANDSFLPDDFIFRDTGRRPHTVMGTEGARVIAELAPAEMDIILPKRRFSAFLGTGLEATLRDMGVETIAVTGISTPVCVLTTALDGMAHDFHVILIDDCCAAARRQDHEAILQVYGGRAFQPLLRVMSLEEFLATL